MKSIPLSVKAAAPSPRPDLSFLTHRRRTWIMGVLNATPDSFYGDSRVAVADRALALTSIMIEQGVDVLDIGGESTRPGAPIVSAQQEQDRITPILAALRKRWPTLPLSIDTQKASVAKLALACGADIINDISALRADPAMAEVVSDAQTPVVLMHMQGTPQTMQIAPRYENVIDEVKQFFEERLNVCARHKISEARVILDPGIGFGKTQEHNLSLLKNLSAFLSFGRPLLVGVSRKSFLGKDLAPEDRLEGSIAAGLWAVREGATALRVHDVGATVRAVRAWERIAVS